MLLAGFSKIYDSAEIRLYFSYVFLWKIVYGFGNSNWNLLSQKNIWKTTFL